MLHNEARKLLVQAFKKCHNARKIASIFSVSRSTVYRLEKQQERTGSVALRTHQRGRKHLLDRTDLNHIQSQIEAHRDITIEELRQHLHLKASYSTVERAVRGLGYTIKKKSTPASVGVPDVAQKRALWKDSLNSIDAKHLVFLDESGVNTNMTRRYGRSIGKTRVADHVPLNTPTTTTVLSSIRTDGSHIAVTYQGGTTGERFVSYLKEHLLTALKPGDVVVMDNLRSHHVREVEEAFAGTGVKYCYLPPYSPDLNPIEKMWSKMKSILRHWKVRETQKLPEAIYAALNLVTESDCLHWFHFCGCC